MNIVGFDTSTAATAACVLRSDGESFELTPPPERLFEPPAHARELMPALAELMERAELDWPDVDALAVGRGPGTFTGLRIGVATARALAQARSLPGRGVSSLAALAAGIDAPRRLAVLDAKRGEVFAALYEGGELQLGPLVETPEELAERLRDEPETPLAAGDGSVRFREVFEAAGIAVAPDRAPSHVVRGLHVCSLALDAPDAAPETLLPEYLRAPDARPSR